MVKTSKIGSAHAIAVRGVSLGKVGLLAGVVLDAFANEPDIDIAVLPVGSPPADILAGHPDVVMVGVADPPTHTSSTELLRQCPSLGLGVAHATAMSGDRAGPLPGREWADFD